MRQVQSFDKIGITMIEHEIKILDINIPDVESKLAECGFRKKATRDFKRAIFDVVPPDAKSWIRLRTDGDITTLTLKKSVSDAIDGMLEIEVGVSSYQQCLDLLQAAGIRCSKVQENSRTDFTSQVDTDIEISIDYWPGIPPYLEIEGPTVERVKEFIRRLELMNHRQTSATTAEVYRIYGKTLS